MKNISNLVGNTPLVTLNAVEKEKNLLGNLFIKIEGKNPAGSVKDRIAKGMIDHAEREGKLASGGIIIEPTSGNTGIGLAAIGASRGYRVILTMPETMSVERRNMLKIYGAEIVLTEGSLGMKGAIEKAKELVENMPGAFMPSQFDNPINPKTHYLTTGPEIWKEMDEQVDVFIAGVGTGGTISGTGKYLKEKNPNCYIVAVEPLASNILSKGKAGPHKIQGIGAGFIPQNLNTEIYDEVITVTDEEAFEGARLVAKLEGISAGVSSGAALMAGIKIAKRKEFENKNIVMVFPDGMDRYFSTPLFQEKEN